MSGRVCSRCGAAATVYAMDTIAGGWADYYCDSDTPRGWIVERLRGGFSAAYVAAMESTIEGGF